MICEIDHGTLVQPLISVLEVSYSIHKWKDLQKLAGDYILQSNGDLKVVTENLNSSRNVDCS
jgi:hypothetical protein